jgi:hypothetical protein
MALEPGHAQLVRRSIADIFEFNHRRYGYGYGYRRLC